MQASNFASLPADVNAADPSGAMYGARHPSHHYDGFAHSDESASAASITSQDLHDPRKGDPDLGHYPPRYYEAHGATSTNIVPDPTKSLIDPNHANYYLPNSRSGPIHEGQWQNFRSDSMSSLSSNQSTYPYDWPHPHSHRREGDITPNSDYYARSRSTSYASVGTNISHATYNSRSSTNPSYVHPSHSYAAGSRSRGSSYHSTGHYDSRPHPVPSSMYNQEPPPHDRYNYGGGYYNPPDMVHHTHPLHTYGQYPETHPNAYRGDAGAPMYSPKHPALPHPVHGQGYGGHPSYHNGWSEVEEYGNGYYHPDMPYDPPPGGYMHSSHNQSGTDTSVSSLCSRMSSVSLDSSREYGEGERSMTRQSMHGVRHRVPYVDMRDMPHGGEPGSIYHTPPHGHPSTYSADGTHPRVSNIQGRVISIARSQTGCKDMVSLLSSPTAEEEGIAEAVLNEVAPHAQELSLDPNGNYVVQQLIKTLPLDLRLVLLYCITGRFGRDELMHHLPGAAVATSPAAQDLKGLSKYKFEEPEDAFLPPLVQLSLSNHGTHVVQCLVDHCTEPVERYSIMAPFRMKPSSVARLSRDSNGCHVIMRLLRIEGADSSWVISRILEDLAMLSKQKHGAPIIMQAIDAATANVRRMLVNTVIKSAKTLASDPCANFIISHILSTGTKAEANACVLALLGSIKTLAVKKYGSNVVERCLGAIKPGPQAGRSGNRNKNVRHETVPSSLPLVSPSVIAQVLNELLNLDEEALKDTESLGPEEPVSEQILNNVVKEIDSLLSSTYGNYVMDRVFDAVFLAGPVYVKIFEGSLTILLPTLKESQISKGFMTRISNRLPHLLDKIKPAP